MKARLIIAVVSTLLDEVVIVAILLWVLPYFGISLPVPIMILIGVLWLSFAIFLYVSGNKIFYKKPLAGQTNMVGLKGLVVKPLSPEGMVKINGELWEAQTTGDVLRQGERVIVEGQDGLKLIVRKADTGFNKN